MSSRFRHILIPVDTVQRDTTALDVALNMAETHNARVSLLHVIQSISVDDEDSADEESTAFYEDLRQRIEPEVEQIAKRFRDARIDIDVQTPVGDQLQEIVSFCQDQQVDLIVMASHPVDPNDLSATWGTLSYRVSVICDCAILLVK